MTVRLLLESLYDLLQPSLVPPLVKDFSAMACTLEEIRQENHLRYIKPLYMWEKLPINWFFWFFPSKVLPRGQVQIQRSLCNDAIHIHFDYFPVVHVAKWFCHVCVDFCLFVSQMISLLAALAGSFPLGAFVSHISCCQTGLRVWALTAFQKRIDRMAVVVLARLFWHAPFQ